MKKSLASAAIAAVLAGFSVAATAVPATAPFDPLTSPATAAETDEATAPFKLPNLWNQTKVVDVADMDVKFGGNYPTTFRMWDMIEFSPTGKLLYIPHEVQQGAGVTRYNMVSGVAKILIQGNNTGIFESDPAQWDASNDDFGAFDPAVFTPNRTLVVGEEWSGNGRMFEMMNPYVLNPADAQWRWLSNIPSVSHEGIKFDSNGNMYFVDEDKSGSIYKFVPANASDLSTGQVFVLKIDGYNGDAGENWNAGNNPNQPRTGIASWVAVTDTANVAVTTADSFDFTARGGRLAADELVATPYGRPEDLEFGMNTNSGKEILYFTATSESVVYSVELTSDTQAVVKEFVNANTTPDTIGNDPVGNNYGDVYGLGSPDNLAIDMGGNIYVIEDQNPGDIWFVSDSDKDGTGASMSLFAALGPFGSEPTGFRADKRDPFKFFVAIQHPDSDNDAVWSIWHDLANDCYCGDRTSGGTKAGYMTCVKNATNSMISAGDMNYDQRATLVEMARMSRCRN